ncbi:MAG: hypothetical protein WAO51_00960 [Bacillota bacterium]
MQPSAELMKAVYEAVRSVYPDAVWEEAPLAQQGDSVKSAAWLNNQDYKGVI